MNLGDPAKDLKYYLNRPTEHLQKYPHTLEAILNETDDGIPDGEYLREAIKAFKNLQSAAELRTFQLSMGRGQAGKWEWYDLVGPDVRQSMTKTEMKRQAVIFELIKGEMGYVSDLKNLETIFIEPLRNANPPIIEPDLLEKFIEEVFHNSAELVIHHARLLEQFHQIQREQHPSIHSITAPLLDAALNFRDAYMEYIPNYPIGVYRIDEEMIRNRKFKDFVDQCVRHPDAHRLDMKSFINRPIPRLLRYELLLKSITDESPPNHPDHVDVPQVLELIKSLGKDSEPGVETAKQKVELWRYHSNLVFKPTDYTDLDLLDPSRSLVHAGKLLRAPDSGLEWNGWSEVYVLLFDNYLVMTKPKERDGRTRYNVNRRPIPLELLTLVNFTDPPTQKNTGILRGLRGGQASHAGEQVHTPNGTSPDTATDSRAVFPCTFNHSGRAGGIHVLFADSAQSRAEWKQKLEEALGIRQVVQESNKIFEVETLSADTFLSPSIIGGVPSAASWGQDSKFTGKVTCSVPFNTADGRPLVAVGCTEGVWIGFRHDPKSMRRVLHLKLVTQCAILEDFGIFLVLADKSLFAYHIEALVPSAPGLGVASQVPQKLNGNKDVHFFSVGNLHNRTLIIYMKKKGLDSIFRVLEPIGEKINDRSRAPASLGSRFFRNNRSEWFRVYRDFFLPSESFDLVFLKARIAILCTKGFEVMDLEDFKSVTIPSRDDPQLAGLAKRCEACKPLGMYRSTESEFLLVYDEFGVYVDKHGDPSRNANIIEWEGAAERVALHHPYVLLFDPRFIEVRHLITGRLAQIIMGNEVRCIWDGRGVSGAAPVQKDEDELEEAQVHAVMNEPGSVVGQRAIAQHVFELVPTVPLFLPGSDGVGNGVNTPGFHREASFRPASTASRSVSSATYSPPNSPHGRESWR